MPAWWKRKTKLKSKSTTTSPRTNEPETPAAALLPEDDQAVVVAARRGTKGKANSFDAAVGYRKSTDHLLLGSGGGRGGGDGAGFVFGHPLPLPTSRSPRGVSLGSGSASTSVSSIGSSASSDETPDHASYGYSDPMNTPRGRNVARDLQRHEHAVEKQLFSCSPVSEHPSGGNVFSYGQTSTETIFTRRTASPSPGLRGHPFPTSPAHPISFGLCPTSPNRWQDNLTSTRNIKFIIEI